MLLRHATWYSLKDVPPDRIRRVGRGVRRLSYGKGQGRGGPFTGKARAIWPPHSIEGLGNKGKSQLLPAVGTLSLVSHLPGVKTQPSPAAGTAEMVEHCCRCTPLASQP